MKYVSVALIGVFLSITIKVKAQNVFYRGADLSYLQELEAHGAVYYDNNKPENALSIFKNNGVNIIRLRLWYHPQNGYNDLSNTLQMAKRISQKGLKLLLDIHYSDTWADPSHQTKPVAWANLSYSVLKDSVYSYTYRVIKDLKDQGSLPAIVQIGNEVTDGMLWNTGRVGGNYDNPTQWSQFASLLKEGIKGAKDAAKPDTISTMIHIDRGGDFSGCKWFFDNLQKENVKFDIIGLSYYPWWDGSLTDMTNTVDQVAGRYNKPVLIAETAYPWTLKWDDNVNNIVGSSSQLLPNYPADEKGQQDYLDKVFSIIRNVPNHLGIGVVYWEPDFISVPGVGSDWENLAMFDFSGNALPSMSAFKPLATPIEKEPSVMHLQTKLEQNYPNPFNPTTVIPFQLSQTSEVRLSIYNILGERIATLVNSRLTQGSYTRMFSSKNISSGIYFYKLTVDNHSFVRKMLIVK